jgi:hypothetical protein
MFFHFRGTGLWLYVGARVKRCLYNIDH